MATRSLLLAALLATGCTGMTFGENEPGDGDGPSLGTYLENGSIAVDGQNEHVYVLVAKEGGRFEPRRIRAGARAGPKVEVVSGLSEGETVVTTANFLIDSESRLRAAIQGFSGAPGEHR